MSEAGKVKDLIKVRKPRESVILIFCKERLECPCDPGILKSREERKLQKEQITKTSFAALEGREDGRWGKEKKVAESEHSISALAVFTRPIPVSCSPTHPKLLIAQLTAGLKRTRLRKRD